MSTSQMTLRQREFLAALRDAVDEAGGPVLLEAIDFKDFAGRTRRSCVDRGWAFRMSTALDGPYDISSVARQYLNRGR